MFLVNQARLEIPFKLALIMSLIFQMQYPDEHLASDNSPLPQHLVLTGTPVISTFTVLLSDLNMQNRYTTQRVSGKKSDAAV